MTATTRQPKRMTISRSSTSLAESAGLRRAGDAELRRRHRLEASLADLAAAGFATAVLTIVELHQRILDLTQRVGEAPGQRLDLRSLRGDLTRVGEAAVEREVATGPEAQLAQLAAEAIALLLQLSAQHCGGRFGHGGMVLPRCDAGFREAPGSASARMGLDVDRPQALCRHLRVDLGGREACVA